MLAAQDRRQTERSPSGQNLRVSLSHLLYTSLPLECIVVPINFSNETITHAGHMSRAHFTTLALSSYGEPRKSKCPGGAAFSLTFSNASFQWSGLIEEGTSEQS